ncbi:ABC transporter ATP-binding protein [Pseudonocardia spinosispora]|uniref:ABC transporter ATP-binding protein n=1 Tax=Pseudonocardia spinosispora TaxID=103441 RepID=UPI00042854A4|nr:ABC transporter ATP-binding protein [Pseudonocardia spinosispora]
MIRHLFRLYPHPGLLVRLGMLHAVLAVLQGLLLGLLVPILRALLQPRPDFAAATPWLVTGAIGMVGYVVLNVTATPVGFAASMQLSAQLRHHLMAHVTTLPLGWFGTEQKARLSRTVTTAAGNIATLAVTIGAPAITCTLVPATVLVVTFLVDWRMALLLLLVAALAVPTLRRAGRIASTSEEELEAAATEIAGRAIELGQAQPVLRAAGHGATGSARMRAALDEHRRSYRVGLRRSMVPDLTYTAVVMLGFVAVLVLGSVFLLNGTLPVAEAVALVVLAVRFLEPLANLIELIGALRALDNNITRVETILTVPALPKAENPVRNLEHSGIEFVGVTYRYAPDAAPALDDVSLHCRPGSTTALVGPSGSGKTTVTRLIARFFDVDSGSVRVGGVDVRELDQAALLAEIAIVFQDVYLFDDTIEANLRLARPDATDAELAEAARAARLDEVVDRLPNGWRTLVGEGGSALSGGERQRVSIARAFLKQASIVLIDEAGSALDPENEGAVSDAIATLASDPNRTVIVIAHRPATLATADNVVALDNGRVTETGHPEVLRLAHGPFAHLYTQYEQARGWRITAR